MANSNRSNLLVLALAIACAGFGGLAWLEHRRVEDLEARLAAALREQADAQNKAVAADTRTRELELAATTPRARSPADAPAGSPPMARRDGGRGQAGLATMLNNPDFQQAMVAGIRGNLDARYATLFKKLRLSPAELEKLKNLLVDRQAAGFDVMTAAAGEGVGGPGVMEGMRSLMEKAQADVDEGIRSVLGEPRFAQYKDFDKNSASYSVADQLERRLSYTQTPLQPAQADELVRILSENAPSTAAGVEGRGPFGGGNPMLAPLVSGSANVLVSGGQPAITDQALAQAQGILTADQYESLKQLQAEQQAMSKLAQGRMGFRMGPGQGGGSRPPGGG